MTIDEAKTKLNQAFEHFEGELKKVRTGRASASVLEGISVEVYGQDTPLTHVANVIALDAQTLQIQPFDPNNLEAISAAIRNDQSLGLNPADDGKVVRVPIPPMTEERRRDVVKQVGEKAEESKIAMRNIRHDVLNTVKSQEKDGEITKDDLAASQKEVDELIADSNKMIDEAVKAKEAEIMTV